MKGVRHCADHLSEHLGIGRKEVVHLAVAEFRIVSDVDGHGATIPGRRWRCDSQGPEFPDLNP